MRRKMRTSWFGAGAAIAAGSLVFSSLVAVSAPSAAVAQERAGLLSGVSADRQADCAEFPHRRHCRPRLKLKDEDGTAKVGKSRVLVLRGVNLADKQVQLQRLNVRKSKKTGIKQWQRVKAPASSGRDSIRRDRWRWRVSAREGVQLYRARWKTRVGDDFKRKSNEVPFKGLVQGSSCSGDGHLNACVSVQNAALQFVAPDELGPVSFTHRSSVRTHGYAATPAGAKAEPPPPLTAGTPQQTSWQYRNASMATVGIDVQDGYSVDIAAFPTSEQVSFAQENDYSGGTNTGTCQAPERYIRCSVLDGPDPKDMDVSTTYRVETAPTTIELTNNLPVTTGTGDLTRVGSPQLSMFRNDPVGESSNSAVVGTGESAYYGLYRAEYTGNTFTATYKTDPDGKYGGGQFVLTVVMNKDTLDPVLSTCSFQQANNVTANCDLTVGTNAPGPQTVAVNFRSS